MLNKVTFAFGLILLFVSCNHTPKPIIINGAPTCWTIIPMKSIYSYDDNSGVCFYPNGSCFRYINRNDQRIPYGTYLDISSVKDILHDWQYQNDSLIMYHRHYSSNVINKDSIILVSSNEELLIIRDTLNYEINWGVKIDSIPSMYLN